MIRVLKRDGTSEPFDRYKLRGCLLGLLRSLGEDPWHGEVLSSAVEQYLRRRGILCITSAALLEMVLTTLRISGLGRAGAELERRHAARLAMRARLILVHGAGVRTAWSKDWLVRRLCSRWRWPGRSSWSCSAGGAARSAGKMWSPCSPSASPPAAWRTTSPLPPTPPHVADHHAGVADQPEPAEGVPPRAGRGGAGDPGRHRRPLWPGADRGRPCGHRAGKISPRPQGPGAI